MEFPENDQLMFWGEVTDDDITWWSALSKELRTRTDSGSIRSSPGERSELGSPIKIIDEAVC